MHFYEYFVPTKAMVGLNLIEQIGRIIKRHTRHKKVALICDGGLWIKSGVDRLKASLASEKLEVAFSFTGLSSNPKLSECRQGYDALGKHAVGICIALGGGSILDGCKWIAHKTDVDLFIGIPTTAGTGSEINEWAVITDDRTHIKNSLRCRAPDIALLDATVTTSMPPIVTLFSAMDAFSHGLEAYFSYNSSPLTDMLALQGCKNIVENIEKCMDCGEDLEARAKLQEGSLYTGMAMLNAGLGILHCVANILPGLYPQYSHGYVCGSLIHAVLEFNQEAISMEKHLKIFPLAQKAVKIFESYMAKYQLTGITIEASRLPELAATASKNLNRATNPRRVTKKQVEKLLREVFIIQPSS